jgi:predicted AlkP superfamily pyrophosphatase or phosphodiesterase
MIHNQLLEKIRQTHSKNGFLYPYYGSYSLAEIVPSILKWFGVSTVRAGFGPDIKLPEPAPTKSMIFFMIDGLGFDYFSASAKTMPFFKNLSERGEVYPITSTFPSTTPAALTTIHTGLTPQEHALPEWSVYFEEVDKVIETLPFRHEHHDERDSLLQSGGTPDMLYEGDTIYERLQFTGIRSYSFIFHEYDRSAYHSRVKRGSTVIPYANEEDLMSKLVDTIHDQTERAYYFVYWTKIDSVQHTFGPGSSEHLSELQHFSEIVQNGLVNKIDQKSAKNIVLALTADHGQSAILDEQIIYLNQYISVEQNFAKSLQGTTIVPSGSPHDVFLFVDPTKRDEVCGFLKSELKDKAEVLKTEEAIKQGLFGFNDPRVRFLRRIGNILILPYPGFHVWYRRSPEAFWGMTGIHGGLAEAEMFVPFAVAELSDLIKQ